MVNAIMLNVMVSTQAQITTIWVSQTDAISLFTVTYTGTTTFSIITISKMTLSITTFSIMTFSIMRFIITTFIIATFIITTLILRINIMKHLSKWATFVMLSAIHS